jgi:hypothetical protein
MYPKSPCPCSPPPRWRRPANRQDCELLRVALYGAATVSRYSRPREKWTDLPRAEQLVNLAGEVIKYLESQAPKPEEKHIDRDTFDKLAGEFIAPENDQQAELRKKVHDHVAATKKAAVEPLKQELEATGKISAARLPCR